MRKNELHQIYRRFYNPKFEGSIEEPAKHSKPVGTLIWDSSVRGTFRGSIRETFLNRRKA
jgi:hypothetical protein